MTSVPAGHGETSSGHLAAISAGRSGSDMAAFYPSRHVTAALLTKMRLEYIPPDLVAKQWSNIHKGVTK